MPRPSIGETAMTGAERQARWRAARETGRSFASAGRQTAEAGSDAGTIRSPQPWNSRLSTPHGWMPCRTINRTARWPMPCDRLLNSICPNSRRSNRQEASDRTEQRDGPSGMSGMGHDHARDEPAAPATSPPRPRVDAEVKELNEMTIGRTDDPENPSCVTAFEAATLFGTGSRTPSGPAVVMPRQQRPDT